MSTQHIGILSHHKRAVKTVSKLQHCKMGCSFACSRIAPWGVVSMVTLLLKQGFNGHGSIHNKDLVCTIYCHGDNYAMCNKFGGGC